MRYLDCDRLEKIIPPSPLRGSLNVQVLASTAEDDVKCIFASFSKYLRFGVFMVTFLVSFLVSFYDYFSAKHQKWSKNEVKNEPKITQKWLPWTTLFLLLLHTTCSTCVLHFPFVFHSTWTTHNFHALSSCLSHYIQLVYCL